MEENLNKNIDESYKEAVQKEKENKKTGEEFIPSEPDFSFFVTTLAVQASIDLGVAPHPATNKTEENLSQAKFLIDTLDLLKTKTKGNLTSQEESHLDGVLYELRMNYINKVNKKS